MNNHQSLPIDASTSDAVLRAVLHSREHALRELMLDANGNFQPLDNGRMAIVETFEKEIAAFLMQQHGEH